MREECERLVGGKRDPKNNQRKKMSRPGNLEKYSSRFKDNNGILQGFEKITTVIVDAMLSQTDE
jgi:hypothetical protein